MAAVVAMLVGWFGAMIAKRSMLGGVLRMASSLALGLILLTVVLQLSRFDPRFDMAVPQIGLPEQVVEGGENVTAIEEAIEAAKDVTDKPSIDAITRRVVADHGRFSTVVVEIAKSIPFRHKTGQNESK